MATRQRQPRDCVFGLTLTEQDGREKITVEVSRLTEAEARKLHKLIDRGISVTPRYEVTSYGWERKGE